MLGITTLVCAAVALAFRLNVPAIQAANYAAMPFQIALLVPLMSWCEARSFICAPPLDLAEAPIPFSAPRAALTSLEAQFAERRDSDAWSGWCWRPALIVSPLL